ncbi:hypothetical protein V8F33_009246 [Rhypophila sp. PSN 637]
MKSFAILVFSSLTSLVSSQAGVPVGVQAIQEFNAIARDLITPVAALYPRATDPGYTGDCAKSYTQWGSCAGDALRSDLCGLDLTDPTKTDNINEKCACEQATSIYDCFTSYCTTGTEYSTYYMAVSACASLGFGTTPPAPTNAGAAGGNGNGNGGGGAGKPSAGNVMGTDLVLWTMWAGVAVGSFVVMLL